MAATITTLCYISIDRYIGICRNTFNELTLPHPKYIIPIIWLTILIFFIPCSLYCKKSIKIRDNSCDCYNEWPSHKANVTFYIAIVLIWLIIPFTIMIFCYVNIFRKLQRTDVNDAMPNDPNGSKKKGVKMLILSTSMFFISWFPYAFLFVLKKLEIGDQKLIK